MLKEPSGGGAILEDCPEDNKNASVDLIALFYPKLSGIDYLKL